MIDYPNDTIQYYPMTIWLIIHYYFWERKRVLLVILLRQNK